jgi:predicted PurR-regulated permease PerM
MTQPSQDKVRIVFLVLLLVSISALFVSMIRQFLLTILLAAIFSALAQPLFNFLARLFRGRRVLASACTLILILVLIVGPLLTFFGVLASQAFSVAEVAGPWIEKHLSRPDLFTDLVDDFPVLERVEPYRVEILMKLGQAAGTVGNFLVSGLSATTRHTVTFFFKLSLMLYAMFFFLKDGRVLLDKILSYVPLSSGDKETIVDKFVSVSRATIKGTLVIGIIQGGLAGAALAVAGVHGAVFWGTIMVVLSIIPGIGTALVWLPAVIYFLAVGQILKGILLGLFCGLVVGSADNILRPILVGRDAKLHELVILFATLGGIISFGIVGFILGPVVAALFITVWDIYGTVFQGALQKE